MHDGAITNLFSNLLSGLRITILAVDKAVIAIKHGKKPTREQRKLMEKWKVSTMDWLVERETNNELVLRHRHFENKTKIIPKGVRDSG